MDSKMSKSWRLFFVAHLLFLVSNLGPVRLCNGQTPVTLPHDTIVWIHCENVPEVLSASMDTELLASLNHLPIRNVAISILTQLQREHHQELGGIDLENEDLTETLKTLFEKELTYAAFVIDKQESSFVRFTLNNENWLGKFILSQLQKLPIANGDAFELPIYELMGMLVAVQDSTVCLASEQTALKHAMGIGKRLSNRSLSENRKFWTVHQQVDFKAADIAMFVDTGWLLKKWYFANSNYRPIADELSIVDALGFGANISFMSKDVQWKVNSYLICAQPREGLWSLLSFGEIDLATHPFVPQDADFSVRFKMDMEGLSKAINTWRVKVPVDQFDSLTRNVAQLLPFIVVPVMFHEQLANVLSGDVDYYGTINRDEQVWLSEDCIATKTIADREDQATAFLMSLMDRESLVPRRSRFGDYLVLGDNSYSQMTSRMQELNQLSPERFPVTRVPRKSFAVTGNKVLLFTTEESCVNHLHGITDDTIGLSHTDRYQKSVAIVQQDGGGTAPSVYLYLPGKGLWKWYLLSLTRANYHHQHEVWKVELDENNVENLTLGERIVKGALLENPLDFPLTDIQDFSPITAAVFNSQSGMRIVVFQQDPGK